MAQTLLNSVQTYIEYTGCKKTAPENQSNMHS